MLGWQSGNQSPLLGLLLFLLVPQCCPSPVIPTSNVDWGSTLPKQATEVKGWMDILKSARLFVCRRLFLETHQGQPNIVMTYSNLGGQRPISTSHRLKTTMSSLLMGETNTTGHT